MHKQNEVNDRVTYGFMHIGKKETLQLLRQGLMLIFRRNIYTEILSVSH